MSNYSKSSFDFISSFLETETLREKTYNKTNFTIDKQELRSYSLFLVIKTSPNLYIKTQDTSNMKYGKTWELDMHLRKMNKSE